MTKPRTEYTPEDILALLAKLDPDNAAAREAAAEAETRITMRQAARFVSNQAGRWRACPQRACRRARRCAGEGLPETRLPCGEPADWPRIADLVLFTAFEELRQAMELTAAGRGEARPGKASDTVW